ncbi:alpha/beta hydrolase [Gluconacetobacter sacchari]|uniref:alpha/beta hydrolase n=1 Tax=Gluconacetobacter sacchari TaxID=92759 RepID=UPI0039B60211
MIDLLKPLARLASLGLATLPLCAAAQAPGAATVVPLHAEGAPAPLDVPETHARVGEAGETMIFNVSRPTLALFRPSPRRANGAAVIIAPGGGFVGLAYETEGIAVARRLAERGVTALVLKYRTIRSPDDAMHMPPVHMKEMQTITDRARSGLPDELPPFAGEPHAMEDGARAILLVRQHAKEWGVDPGRVGFIGFSSGAFVAADLAIGDKSTRPSFVGLLYGGLRTPVPPGASPAFIAAAADDAYMPDDGVRLYAAWRKAGAAAELHLYEHGGHGFALKPKGTTSDHWFDAFLWWMQARGFLRR